MAAISTFVENFDGALNTTVWGTNASSGTGSVTFTGGHAELALSGSGSGQFAELYSKTAYDLTGDAVFVYIQPLRTANDDAGAVTSFKLDFNTGAGGASSGYDLSWDIQSNGFMSVVVHENFDFISETFIGFYTDAPDDYAWLRLRESAGTLYFDSAPITASNPPAPGDWVNRGSTSVGTLPITSATVKCTDSSTIASIKPAKFDGLNTSAQLPQHIVDNASPATYTHSGQAGTDRAARLGKALPGTYSYVSPDTVDAIPLGDVVVQVDPTTYGHTPSSTTDKINRASNAGPATYLLGIADVVTEGGTLVPDVPPAREIIPPEPITDAEFQEWLRDETAIRVILLETQYIDTNGNVGRVFLSSRGFVSKPYEAVSNRAYIPLMKGGLAFQQKIALDLTGDQSYGDIELDNAEGDLDHYFDHMWQYQPIRAYVGDARWPRRDFRQIFDGTIEDIDSSSRDTINVRVRDKLYRLQMPLHEEKIGGSSVDADRLLPVAFGDCHNVTPVLQDAQKLRYVYHARQAEGAFEVRDNGIPVQRLLVDGSPASFILPKQPFGRITASVQGEKVNGQYLNTVADLVVDVVKNWGTEPEKRLTDLDIDTDNIDLFRANNPQAIGFWATERITVYDTAQAIAASIGARMTMTADGKMQLVRINIPPIGTPIDVGESDMVGGSLRVVGRLLLTPSVKLGYCKNWTVQTDTAAGLPEEHKALYSREWLSTTAVNQDVRLKYNLWAEPEQENCLLVRRVDAELEVQRRLFLRQKQRHVYEFTGFANLIFTQVGSPMRVKHRRFGLQAGEIGQVVSVSVDWLKAQVTIQVAI